MACSQPNLVLKDFETICHKAKNMKLDKLLGFAGFFIGLTKQVSRSVLWLNLIRMSAK